MDGLAVAAGLPLATFLGAKPKPISAYNSSGLGLMSPEAAADEAEKLLAGRPEDFVRIVLVGHYTESKALSAIIASARPCSGV